MNYRWFFFKRYLQVLLPFHFAHHPLCSNYSKEVFHIKNWYICRGCSFTFGAALVALVVTFIFNPLDNFSLFEVFLFVIGVITPVWIGLFYSFRSRIIKDIIRISLGFGWGISTAIIWLEPLWIYKLLTFLMIVIFWLVFRRIRSIQTSKRQISLCENCMEFNEKTCLGFRNQFEAERLYSREISDYLQQKLSWNDVKEAIKESNSNNTENK